MATATLSYSNIQHEQTWPSETTTSMSPKSPEPSPEWGQAENNNPTFNQNNEQNISNKGNVQNLDSPDSSEPDELMYNNDEKNRELRECLKNIQSNDDPDKAHWNYFKTLLEQEGHEKAQMAYLNYIKNERVLACLQAYKVQEEVKYQWNERQRIKEEQLNQYKQLMCLEETASQNRINQQALSEIDYFKSKWESYALPANAGITPDVYRDIVNKGKFLNSQENLDLLQQNANYLQYNSLTTDMQQIGQTQGNAPELLEVDTSKYYVNSGLLDQKITTQFLSQQAIQKLTPPSVVKRVLNKNDSNALDDIMADFQANGRGGAAPPSPRASRAWSTGSVPTTSPISVRPNLQGLRQMSSPTATTNSVGNIASSVISTSPVSPLASSLPRSTEAELIRQLMLMNLGATSAQLQKQNLYNSQAQYGLQLGSLADSQFRRRRVAVSSTECAFCRNNGEQPGVYRGHILKDSEGRVRCPILRDYTCRNCGATGDMAHTVKYCPLTPKTDLSFTQLQKNLRMANGKRRGSQETAQWTTCDSP